MIADAQGHGVVSAGDPLGQQVLMRHQPGIGPRPGAGHAIDPILGEVLEEEIELANIVGHQDQALVHRTILEGQQPIHRLFVPGIAPQPPDRFGWIGNHRSCANFSCGFLHTPTLDHCLLSGFLRCRQFTPSEPTSDRRRWQPGLPVPARSGSPAPAPGSSASLLCGATCNKANSG